MKCEAGGAGVGLSYCSSSLHGSAFPPGTSTFGRNNTLDKRLDRLEENICILDRNIRSITTTGFFWDVVKLSPILSKDRDQAYPWHSLFPSC